MPKFEEDMQIAMQTELQYLSEQNRRKTFGNKWVFSGREACNADKMAEAGFIFIGNTNEPDAAKCFFCNKALDGWDSTDNPWNEHLKHAPKCKFAKLQKSQSFMTLHDFLILKQELLHNVVNSCMDKLTEEMDKTIDEAFRHKIKK